MRICTIRASSPHLPLLCGANSVAVLAIMPGPGLEEILMRRCNIKYVTARKLVDESRQALGMSRIEPWTPQLQEECFKRLNNTHTPVANSTKTTTSFVSHFRTSIVADLPIVQEEPAPMRRIQPPKPKQPAESSGRAWQAHAQRGRTVTVVKQVPLKPTVTTVVKQGPLKPAVTTVFKQVPLKPEAASSCKARPLMTGGPSTPKLKDPVKYPEVSERTADVTDDSSEERLVEQGVEVVAAASNANKKERVGVVDLDQDIDGKTEAEMIADDCSQATDNSKCFTTAEELGLIDLDDENDPEIATLHKSICGHSIEAIDESEQPLLDKVPSSTQQARFRKHGDSGTDSTGSLSEPGVPLVIYLRFDLPPEVPDDEPLAQCYNLALPVYTRRQRIRASILNSWRRLTGFHRKRRNKVRLTDEDTEMRIQTLVDL
jgi:hypothetical protein